MGVSSPMIFLLEEVQMARKQWAEQWAEYRRQRDEEERRQRVMVITRRRRPPERTRRICRRNVHRRVHRNHDELEYLRAALEDVFPHVTLSTGASLRFAHDARCASV